MRRLHAMLVHVLSETTVRGHADIVRELFDGAVGSAATSPQIAERDAAEWNLSGPGRSPPYLRRHRAEPENLGYPVVYLIWLSQRPDQAYDRVCDPVWTGSRERYDSRASSRSRFARAGSSQWVRPYAVR